jgi:uncharacterized protein
MANDFTIKKSNIAGNGIFAKKEIKMGQQICFLGGELCSLDEIIRRVHEGKEKPSDPLGVENEEYLDLDDVSRTFNHSCSPNSYIRGKNELVGMRDIVMGEEITYDYSTTMNDNEKKIVDAGLELWTCKCNCGSKNCREIIDQFKTLPEELRHFYISNKFMPDFMLKVFG